MKEPLKSTSILHGPPFQGLKFNDYSELEPRPLAWAMLDRPFGPQMSKLQMSKLQPAPIERRGRAPPAKFATHSINVVEFADGSSGPEEPASTAWWRVPYAWVPPRMHKALGLLVAEASLLSRSRPEWQ